MCHIKLEEEQKIVWMILANILKCPSQSDKLYLQNVLEYQKPQLDERDADAKKLIKQGNKKLDRGFISLQSESHPVEFRKVELLQLKK